MSNRISPRESGRQWPCRRATPISTGPITVSGYIGAAFTPSGSGVAPPASLEIFNAPSREVCTVRRERTNTPLQALVTLNDPQFVEAARDLAQSVVKAKTSTTCIDDMIDMFPSRLLARPFRPEERAVVHMSLAKLTDLYQSHPDQASLLLNVGESKPDPDPRPGHRRRLDHAGQ